MLSLPTEKTFANFKVGMARVGKGDPLLLQNIAAVGSIAGLIWSKREFRNFFLIIEVNCENLANSCSWWHEFTLLEITFDHDMFMKQGSNYHQMFIKPILDKTGGDLDIALDFSRQYHIPGNFIKIIKTTLRFSSLLSYSL